MKLKTITRRDVIKNVLKSANRTYNNPEWIDRQLHSGETPRMMLGRLQKLDLDTCSTEDVDRAWGGKGWNSMPSCGHCDNREQDLTYQIGAEKDYESDTAFLCETCMDEMVNEYVSAKLRQILDL